MIGQKTGQGGLRQEPSSDADLVRASRAGEEDAFEDLVRRHQTAAYRVAYHLVGNADDAMEIAQEAFLKAYKNLDGLQRPEAFGAWLLRIVRNHTINFLRSRSVLNVVSGEAISDEDEVATWVNEPRSKLASPVQEIEGRELNVAVQQAIAALPEKERLALVLCVVEGLAYKDAAAVLECSVEAIKWHVFQARKHLRQALHEHL